MRTIQAWLMEQWPELIQALIFIVVAYIALRLLRNWSTSAMRRGRVDTSTQILVRRGLTIGMILITAVIVLGMLGADPAGLVTLVAAVGLAFSLAIQDILKNFFAGVYLLLERPFRVGETIKVKDQQGVVENIGVRTTMLRTADNIRVMVPNALVFSEVVANHTNQHVEPAPEPAEAVSAAPKAADRT
jgi:small-conductance mechanosensitive channel